MKINCEDEKKLYAKRLDDIKPYLFRDYAKSVATKLTKKYEEGSKADPSGKTPSTAQLIQRVYNVINGRVMDWDILLAIEDTIKEHYDKMQSYFNRITLPVAS